MLKRGVSIFGIIFIVIITAYAIYNNEAYATTSFANQINLSGTAATSSIESQIVAVGNNVYAIWKEGTTGEILFKRSTDKGANFSANTNLSMDGTESNSQKIAAAGNNIYVIWRDDTANDEIRFVRSTDSGASFGGSINLSNDVGNSRIPQIAAIGNNVYVIWQDFTATNIFFRSSTDGGTNFSPTPTNAALSLSNDGTSTNPQVNAISNNVYAVWESGTTGEIQFKRSTDNGASFGGLINLSNDAGFDSEVPKISSIGNNVYITWFNNTSSDNVAFARSTDSGASFSAPIRISDKANTVSGIEITATGNNVFVTWSQGTFGSREVYLAVSTDSGATFGNPINLSNNSGDSFLPSITTTGTNVGISWTDGTSGNDDILTKASVDNASNFCGSSTNLSNNSGASERSSITSIAGNTYVAWDDNTANAAGNDILFRAGTTKSTCIAFNASEYKISQTATITVTDTASNGNAATADTITTLTVKSTTDATGITPTFTETGVNTGVFTATISFTTDSSSGTSLQVSAGDTITASFNGVSSTASIFSTTVSWGGATFTLSATPKITITDQNSNTDTGVAETITATITSPRDTPKSTTLTETGVNTGIFQNSEVILMSGSDARYTLKDTVTLELIEPSSSNVQNTDVNAVDTITFTVSSTTTTNAGTGNITPTLTESGPNTGVFNGNLAFTLGDSNGDTIKVSPGDIISVTFLGETSNGLILPNPNPGRSAIIAAVNDQITASFNGATASFTVNLGNGGGGGGGGVVRPGLILDFIAPLTGGSGSSSSKPVVSLKELQNSKIIEIPDEIKERLEQFDPLTPIKSMEIKENFDFPLSINEDGYAIGAQSNTLDTKTLSTDTPNKIKTVFYQSAGLQHITMYLNLKGEENEISNSDTFIRHEKGKPLEIKDPNGFFKDVKLVVSEDGIKKEVEFEIVFDKPMEKTNMILRNWDIQRHSADTKIFDALEIISADEMQDTSLNKEKENGVNEDIDNLKKSISEEKSNEVKQIAVLGWAGYDEGKVSDKQLTESLGLSKTPPNWFKSKLGKWLYLEQISIEEFTKAAKYLE